MNKKIKVMISFITAFSLVLSCFVFSSAEEGTTVNGKPIWSSSSRRRGEPEASTICTDSGS